MNENDSDIQPRLSSNQSSTHCTACRKKLCRTMSRKYQYRFDNRYITGSNADDDDDTKQNTVYKTIFTTNNRIYSIDNLSIFIYSKSISRIRLNIVF